MQVLAASVDKLEDAVTTVARHKLTFPIAYGLDVEEIARATGSFWNEESRFLHATGFMLRSDGAVSGAVYSTGPVGRYTAKDTLGMIEHLVKQNAK